MPYNETIAGKTSNQDKMKTNTSKTGIEKEKRVPTTEKSSRKTGKVK